VHLVRFSVGLVALAAAAAVQVPSDQTTNALIQNASVQAALAAAKASEPRTIGDQIRFSEVPSPPFKEATRGEELRRAFLELGLHDVRVDKVGNVLAERPGASPHPHVVVAAHLDTVFPEGTNVKVRRDGAVLHGPGVGDDSRGLAVLVAVARALKEANVQTPGSITFVANVGEEGLGDLRGMRQLFDDTLKGTVDRFVTVDGSALDIASTFVGSRRYRVTFKGPGGHAFADFGRPNPVNALGRAAAKLAEFRVPSPQTSFNIGRIGGGTAINAIPTDAWMEVDLRSVDGRLLQMLDANFQKAVDLAVAEENARWNTPGMLTVTKERVGDRPGGSAASDGIVRTAVAATRALGGVPSSIVSSSDANYPSSLRIPAIEIGGGGHSANVHVLNESFDTTNSWLGTQRALLLVVALAQK
jgi:acetylornithine deacetylase/succinyl-diaminopimelate desuccinylase-like protein